MVDGKNDNVTQMTCCEVVEAGSGADDTLQVGSGTIKEAMEDIAALVVDVMMGKETMLDPEKVSDR